MNRLTIAATLALGVHVVLLQIDIPWKPPVLLTPRSQAVDISLVTFKKPLPEQAPPKPAKVQPNPRTTPERRKKPVSKPLVQPRHAPRIVQPEPAPDPSPATAAPMPEPHEEVIAEAPAAAIPDETAPASDEEHAAVQMSVPLYDLNPPPVYPWVARRRHYQGTVLLDVRVTAGGRATEVKLAHSSGYPVLDQSALAAVQQWRFEPARQGSIPIETWVQVPVRFQLK
jgi:periplasmic protein TonB